ncbi:MAG: hypothetical protein K9M36_01295 [Candidatus Pacebacteria bacterium]|nr:hypothetical protein [Candidatus Paceibacterota bacterium]
MNNQDVIARFDRPNKQWNVSAPDFMGALDTCIISGCTIEIPEDATGIQDVIFHGSHLQNPEEMELSGEITSVLFNSETKRFEDTSGKEVVINGQHVLCSEIGMVFHISESVTPQ